MQILAEHMELEGGHGGIRLGQRRQIELRHPVQHGPVIGGLAVVGESRVQFGEGVGVHLVHHRTGGQTPSAITWGMNIWGE